MPTTYRLTVGPFHATPGKVRVWAGLAALVEGAVARTKIFLINAPEILPATTDVRTGVPYGENGVEFVGTYEAGGGGGNTYSRGRVVNG